MQFSTLSQWEHECGVEDYQGFALDVNQIELHSKCENEICLPYHGPLPDALAIASSACICIRVVPIRPAAVYLALHMPWGRVKKYRLDCTREEIISLLDRFFDEENDTGLSQYWFAVCHSNFCTWSITVGNPMEIVSLINSFPLQAKEEILRNIEYFCT